MLYFLIQNTETSPINIFYFNYSIEEHADKVNLKSVVNFDNQSIHKTRLSE